MKGVLSVKNFEQYQHYKDRKPPWIKLYNDVLDDYAFEVLPDASKAHLMLIWLLASRTDNRIPNDPEWIARKIGATGPVDIAGLISAGFLAESDGLPGPGDTPLADREQEVCPESEEEAETKKESESGREPEAGSGSSEPAANGMAIGGREPTGRNGSAKHHPVAQAFENYNLVAGDLGLPRAEKLTPERRRKLRARLKDHGIDGWNGALVALEDQPFLLGKGPRGWRASLDFLLQPTSFTKVLERAYAQEAEGEA